MNDRFSEFSDDVPVSPSHTQMCHVILQCCTAALLKVRVPAL